MKKEPATFDVDKEYQLEKYEKNEFTVLMLKEFRKVGKKLSKAVSYEEMVKQGKTLNQEMQSVVAKKEQLKSHLASLKTALDMFVKSGIKLPLIAGEQQPGTKDSNTELQEHIKEACEKAEKRLGYFLVIAATLQHKDLLPNPFNAASIPTPEQKTAMNILYKDMISIQEGREISIADEAKRIFQGIYKFLTESPEGIDSGEGRKPSYAELVSVVDQIAENKVIAELRFKARKAEEHVKAPAPKEQYVEAPAPKIQKPEEHKPAPVPEPVKAPPAPAIEQDEPGSWAADVKDEEEEEETKVPKAPEAKPAEPQPEVKEQHVEEEEEEEEESGDGFTIAKDKKEVREERLATRGPRGPRGRGRGRGPRRFRGPYEGGRGEHQERRRGPRRGGYQGRGGQSTQQ